MSTSHFSASESRAFLQERVAVLGLALAVAGAVGIGLRTLMGLSFGRLSAHTHDASYWILAVAVLPFVAMWLICRRGELRSPTIMAVETIGIVSASAGYIAMGTTIPPEAGADSITAFVLSFLMFARAALVPSTARRTALLGVAVGIPLVATMYWHYLSVDLEIWRRLDHYSAGRSAVEVALSSVFVTTSWWAITTGLASLVSRIIHGLRSEVRDIERLGEYQIESKLGEGAMGVVYQATHGMLKRPTAIKLLQPGRSDSDSLARFRREVQLTAKLSHPSTVRIYDYGRTPDGLFYYAMELLHGATLQEIVEATGPQPVARVVRILRHCALALDEAHSIGLIHRDVKPSNIMLARQGGEHDVIKVLDFGLVKNLEALDKVDETDSRVVKGTPHFMSPEAIEDPRHIDRRSDIYSLGAVGYFLLSGRLMFEAETLFQIWRKHMLGVPPPLREVCDQPIPEAIEHIVLSCLAKAPDDRPASGQALANALDRLDVARWTNADAERWWSRHGSTISSRRDSDAVRATTKTIAIDLARA